MSEAQVSEALQELAAHIELRRPNDVVASHIAFGELTVEVVASHGYLPAQFLNPRVNLRGDVWGGDAEGRQRFLREVLRAIRAAISSATVEELQVIGIT